MRRLVLVGGGHAQLAVLRALARQRPADLETVLVTPSPWQYYSGMLPGFIAGHYTEADCRIDLRPLAEAAGVRLHLGRVQALTANARQLRLAEGNCLDFDLLSLDPGSETDTRALETLHHDPLGIDATDHQQRLLPVKPLPDFFAAWPRLMACATAGCGYHLSIVGGGAAGVELALAARHALGSARSATHARIDVSLVAPSTALLPGHAESVRKRVQRYLTHSGVGLVSQRAQAGPQGLHLADGSLFPADCVIAATGARPLAWLADSGLACSDEGWVEVNAAHQSTSHPEVFAAGDCCSRLDRSLARSGVHAVHAGPVLAHNLLTTSGGGVLHTYSPRKRSLYLIACGPRHAIASWGGCSAEGRWAWHWKDRIDRAFIRRHTL